MVNFAQNGADKLGEYLVQCSKKRAVESIIPAYDLQQEISRGTSSVPDLFRTRPEPQDGLKTFIIGCCSHRGHQPGRQTVAYTSTLSDLQPKGP